MANVKVTKHGTNGIYVDFGDYAGEEFGYTTVSAYEGFNAVFIEHIEPKNDDVICVKYEGRDAQTWPLTHDGDYSGSDAMIVDTIEGVAPTSQSDLIKKLLALL